MTILPGVAFRFETKIPLTRRLHMPKKKSVDAKALIKMVETGDPGDLAMYIAVILDKTKESQNHR